jgi:DNA polymerase elongation subunit (family B)
VVTSYQLHMVGISRLLCFGFKFEGEDTIVVDEREGREVMIRKLWDLLNQTDMLVSYNGQSFDTPKVNSEFMKLGLGPPSPYKEIDLYRQIRKHSKFYSGKLGFVAQRLVNDTKTETGGFQLWKDVLAGDEAGWGLFRKYQVQDVDLLVTLFDQVRPWIKMPHPISPNPVSCHNCGSTTLHRRGVTRTLYSTYQRYMCTGCGKWLRSQKRVSNTEVRPAL